MRQFEKLAAAPRLHYTWHMRETVAIIERVWQLDAQWQRVELAIEAPLMQLQPGQVLLALASEASFDPYLREVWHPVAVQGQHLVVERPLGEAYLPGQRVNLLGPVGNPYPWKGGGQHNLLLIAQDAPPTPLLWLAQMALQQGAAVALMLGGEVQYAMPGIPAAVEVLQGDADQHWMPQADVLQWASQIYLVTDAILWREKFSNLYYTLQQLRGQVVARTVFGVLAMPLPCGTGACMACMVRSKGDPLLACQEGIAFDLTELLLL